MSTGSARVALCLTAALGATLSGCGGGGSAAMPLAIIGEPGRGQGQFVYPRAIVAGADRFYVVDKAARIQAFSFAGDYLVGWHMPESQAGKPVGLGLAPDGRIFVPDTHYGRVVVFSPDGELLHTFGSYGDKPGQFRLPTDIVVTDASVIYVGEYGGNDRINCFDPNFVYQNSFADVSSAAGRVIRPQGIALDDQQTLWAVDAFHHRVCQFDLDGRLRAAFGELGDGLGELRYPYGVDFLSDGTLVVVEYGNNRVQRFTRAGESLGVWGGPGRKPGQLAGPWGVAVLPDDRVLIVDAGNHRVQVIAGLSPHTWRRD